MLSKTTTQSSKTLFFILFLLAPFINFLRFNSYGYSHVEVLIIAVILVAVGLMCAGTYAISNWGTRALLLAVVVTLVLSFFPGWSSLFALMMSFCVVLIIAMLLANNINEILTIFAVIFILGIVLLPSPKQLSDPQFWSVDNKTISSKLPSILYLILDEHLGIDAIPPEITPGATLKSSMLAFYKHFGFSLFTSAYSHYPATYNSIPNVLNFSTSNRDNFYFSDATHRSLKQNIFFRLLSQRGYQIRVYQPDFIDYCKPDGVQVNACYTNPSMSTKIITQINLPTDQRFVFLLRSFLLQSSCYQIAMQLYMYKLQPLLIQWGWHAPDWSWYQARVSSLSMPDEFATLRNDILRHPTGTLFFAHLLTPHNPFVYTADCHLISPVSLWQIGHGPSPIVNTTTSRANHYSAYEGQVMCVQQQMQSLFTAMQAAGIYNNFIIIVHGDHGSRIGIHRPIAAVRSQLTQQDFKDYYVTLFALKIPGENTTTLNPQLRDLQSLLAQVTQNITGHPVPYLEQQPYVYLYPLRVGMLLSTIPVADFKSG